MSAMLVTHMLTLRVNRASITHSDATKSLNVIQLLSQPDIFNFLVSILLDRIGPVEVNRPHTCLNMQSLIWINVTFLPSTKERH